mgnify:CR=1 FL=1
MVGLPRDNRARAAGLILFIGNIVHGKNIDPVHGKARSRGNVEGPILPANVPADDGEWGDGAQRLQDIRLANISAMGDVVAALEQGKSLRPQQSMGIRDGADPHCAGAYRVIFHKFYVRIRRVAAAGGCTMVKYTVNQIIACKGFTSAIYS